MDTFYATMFFSVYVAGCIGTWQGLSDIPGRLRVVTALLWPITVTYQRCKTFFEEL